MRQATGVDLGPGRSPPSSVVLSTAVSREGRQGEIAQILTIVDHSVVVWRLALPKGERLASGVCLVPVTLVLEDDCCHTRTLACRGVAHVDGSDRSYSGLHEVLIIQQTSSSSRKHTLTAASVTSAGRLLMMTFTASPPMDFVGVATGPVAALGAAPA